MKMFNFHVTDTQDLQTFLVEEFLERLQKGVTFGIYDVDFSVEKSVIVEGRVELLIDVNIVVSGFGTLLYPLYVTAQINKSVLNRESEDVLATYLEFLESLVEGINKEEQKETVKGVTYVSGSIVNKMHLLEGKHLALVS